MYAVRRSESRGYQALTAILSPHWADERDLDLTGWVDNRHPPLSRPLPWLAVRCAEGAIPSIKR